MQSKAKTVIEYLKSLPEGRKADVVKLYKLVRKWAPKLKPEMVGGMIGFGKFPYKTKSGLTGDWFVVGLANQKNYISMYFCAVEDGEYIAEKNKNKLGKASVGKSCVRFKKMDDLEMREIERLVKLAAKIGPMNPA